MPWSRTWASASSTASRRTEPTATKCCWSTRPTCSRMQPTFSHTTFTRTTTCSRNATRTMPSGPALCNWQPRWHKPSKPWPRMPCRAGRTGSRLPTTGWACCRCWHSRCRGLTVGARSTMRTKWHRCDGWWRNTRDTTPGTTTSCARPQGAGCFWTTSSVPRTTGSRCRCCTRPPGAMPSWPSATSSARNSGFWGPGSPTRRLISCTTAFRHKPPPWTKRTNPATGCDPTAGSCTASFRTLYSHT